MPAALARAGGVGGIGTEPGGAGCGADVPAAGGAGALLGGQAGPLTCRRPELFSPAGNRRWQRLRGECEGWHVVSVVDGAGQDLEGGTPGEVTFVEIGCHVPDEF